MQDNGPLIALVFFVLISIFFGFYAHEAFVGLEGEQPDKSDGMDAKILARKEAVEEATRKVETARATIKALQSEFRNFADRGEYFSEKLKEYEDQDKRRAAEVKAGEKFKEEGTKLGTTVSEAKSETVRGISKSENEDNDRTATRIQDLKKAMEASQERGLNFKKTFETTQKKHGPQRDYEKSVEEEYKRQLEHLTTRERERPELNIEPDGKVILSDPIHNTIVIDLGTAHGVKNGFRFECFALRPGKVKVLKAYLEVRKANANNSECMIVTKLVKLPKDPMSPYVAGNPEELFSPYHATGQKGAQIQELSAPPKVVVMGMNQEDPIVEGDLVQNPFFRIDRPLVFYVANKQELKEGLQKSAIAYDWVHIERVVKMYGGKVAKDVDLGVDFIIAPKDPEDDARFLRAVDLGIPVVYEWELFRFLDQR